MKIAMLGNNKKQFYSVFDNENLNRLKLHCDVSDIIAEDDLDKNAEYLSECEAAFSTWGMMVLSEVQIKKYFPNLKYLFYAAGTVQNFARPFLNVGVRVFNAAFANGIPVAEYTFAQIVLAAKGYFQSAKNYRPFLGYSAIAGRRNHGNYQLTVGLIGLGVIGKMVAQKLKSINADVLVYDPFISKEEVAKYDARLVDLQTLFKESDVISNHLANKKELENFLDKKYFKLMKNNATFINTARGAQINERHLAAALLAKRGRTAVVDVIKAEYCPILSPLWWCHNAVMTPHIAGSTGHEVTRMAALMIEQFEKILSGDQPSYEVTLANIDRMA